MMALRGLPAAKALSPMLAEAESRLAEITARLENKAATDQELLDTLVALAARVERATAENQYRFAATRAYDAIVSQRIQELRESRSRARRPSASSCSGACRRRSRRWRPPRSA